MPLLKWGAGPMAGMLWLMGSLYIYIPSKQLLMYLFVLSGAIEELQRIANQYLSLADSTLPGHAHPEAADRDTLRKEAGAALEWLNEKVALQSQLHKYDDPMLTTADIHKKRDVVERVCKPIASKPPPKKEAPAPTPAEGAAPEGPAPATEGAAAGGDAADAAPMEEEALAAGGEAPMEQ
eukprot:GHUV01036370.1.p1 GENE.GHUV01036370.1~~GHUV01036370.1.p1  ORF type:complete len:180 (+),score=72.79 GHUV01036370.1:18-557(+)